MEILYILGIFGLVLVFAILGVACLEAEEDLENWRETNYFGDKK
jgi:hypothetical protein